MLVKMVEEIGVTKTAKELGLAKSTVSELYNRDKVVFGLSTGVVLQKRSGLVR